MTPHLFAAAPKPRVAVLSLASDFGCQVALSNFPQLLESLETIELVYWQLVLSADLPDDFDIAIIEGAVTTTEHEQFLLKVRGVAKTIITIGACAGTGGVPGMIDSQESLKQAQQEVYPSGQEGAGATPVADARLVPRPVSAVIDVDYTIPGCPIDSGEFSNILQGALLGVNERTEREPLCAYCKIIEAPCFYLMQGIAVTSAKAQGAATTATPCLGLVTQTGCGALCIGKGRPCTGCRGVAIDANLPAAREFVRKAGRSVEEFDAALRVYNSYYLEQRSGDEHHDSA
ncbi:MAG: NADH:ubiquinone oxidoreductase [Coriobacteriia bacterium]|nr:NADH:ubiquinone oxidoreductase [Coriobacteriia bacterium]MCL2537209.1 NADH:ubiquinone oxidoreductase [Coriobacteriia bacterium]